MSTTISTKKTPAPDSADTAYEVKNGQVFENGSAANLPKMIMPYATKLNFAPMLRFWQKKMDSEDVAERILAKEIMERAERQPELWEPIEEYAELAKFSETVELLLAGLFPLNLRDTQLGKAARPFDMESFYMTPAVKKMTMACSMNVKIEKSKQFFMNSILINACASILNQHYGQNLDFDPTVIFTLTPKKGGTSKHFKSRLNVNFMETVALKPLKKLTQEDINGLLGNVYDTAAWLEALPPENFEIHGVVGMDLIDVTKDETLSRLRFKLLEKDAVVKKENVKEIEQLLRTFFGLPELRMGIMALDFPPEKNEEAKYNINHCFLDSFDKCEFEGSVEHSIYAKAGRFQNMLLVEDLKSLPNKTGIEKALLELGLGSILIAPLLSKGGKIIGMVELGTPKAYDLNSFVEFQLQNLLSLFSMAVERSREETDNQVEAVIREKFTAIHPSVEWRFVKAAFNYMNAEKEDGQRPPVERIAFENVFPLYAQSDIVSSSNKRNHAIQEDLLKNLELIQQLLRTVEKLVDFPLLDQYLLETNHRMKEISEELRSSDESLVVDFIVNEVHPLLEEMAKRDTSIALAYSVYQSHLDPTFGIVYQKRKDYEDSVGIINSTISDYLEEEDARSQKMLPHYFEKYKTDGVQFELYVGQSLLQRGEFNNMHLRNLRLWQLQATVEVTRRMKKLKAELPMPLETAELIFVYGQPISIRFRPDDKRFDVDGAYNIRYEIIKKRIDKATITLPDGSQERLTQAGKIAIVYAAEKDRTEYLHYLTYLKRQGIIETEIEDLDLDKLQGVQGLKALRVTVK